MKFNKYDYTKKILYFRIIINYYKTIKITLSHSSKDNIFSGYELKKVDILIDFMNQVTKVCRMYCRRR